MISMADASMYEGSHILVNRSIVSEALLVWSVESTRCHVSDA